MENEEKNTLRKEFQHFWENDVPEDLERISKLLQYSIQLLSGKGTKGTETLTFTIQRHVKGVIKIVGPMIKYGKVNYRLPKKKDIHEVELKEDFVPLEQIQRSLHFIEDSFAKINNLLPQKEEKQKDKKSNKINHKEDLVFVLSEVIPHLELALSQVMLPFSGIFSNFSNLEKVYKIEKILNLQNYFEQELEKNTVIEFSFFQGKLYTSFHELRFTRSAKKKKELLKQNSSINTRDFFSSLKMKKEEMNEKTKKDSLDKSIGNLNEEDLESQIGRTVIIETEKKNVIGYVKRSYHSSYSVQYIDEAFEKVKSSIKTCNKLLDKLKIIQYYDCD